MKLQTLTLAVVLLASGMASADSPNATSQPPRRLLAARPAETLPAPRPDAGPPPSPYSYHPQLQQRAPIYSPYSMIRYDGLPATPAPAAPPAGPPRLAPAPIPARPAGRLRYSPPEFLPPPVLGSP
jgi:hypothetical protein